MSTIKGREVARYYLPPGPQTYTVYRYMAQTDEGRRRRYTLVRTDAVEVDGSVQLVRTVLVTDLDKQTMTNYLKLIGVIGE